MSSKAPKSMKQQRKATKKAVQKTTKRTIITSKSSTTSVKTAESTRHSTPMIQKSMISLSTPKSKQFSLPTFNIKRFFSADAYTGNQNYQQDPKLIESRVFTVLQGFDKVNKDNIKTQAHFAKDLGLDSLDRVEVMLAIEEEFNTEFTDEQSDKFSTIFEVVDFIAKKPDIHLRTFKPDDI
jgi:NADH dehydrogenase (ubiquinone) 1 alpha/beta subcomplex 1